MDKHFAFLLRQYLSLSNLIAVKAGCLHPRGKANSEASSGAAAVAAAPAGLPGCPRRVLSVSSLLLLSVKWPGGLGTGEAKGAGRSLPGTRGRLLSLF